MEDITLKLGLNNIDWNKFYTEYKNKGFNIDPINGRKEEPFYSVKLVSHTEEYIKTNLGQIPKEYYPIVISCFNTAREKGINKNRESFAKGVYALYTESIKKLNNRNKNNTTLTNKMPQDIKSNKSPNFNKYKANVVSIITNYLKDHPKEMPEPEYTAICGEKGLMPKDIAINVLSSIINVITSEIDENGKYKDAGGLKKDDVISAYKGYRDLLTKDY